MLLRSSNVNIEENICEKENKKIKDGADASDLETKVETNFIVIPDSDTNSNLTSSSNIMIKELEENSSPSNNKELLILFENYLESNQKQSHKSKSPSQVSKYHLNVFKNENLNSKAVALPNNQTNLIEGLCKENLDSNNNQVSMEKRDKTNCNEELDEDSDTCSEYSFSNPTESFLEPIDTHQMTQEFIGFIQELDNYYIKNPNKAQKCQYQFSKFTNKSHITETADSDDQLSCSQGKIRGLGRGMFKSTLNSPNVDQSLPQLERIEPINQGKLGENLHKNNSKNEKDAFNWEKSENQSDKKAEQENVKEQNEKKTHKTSNATNSIILNEKCMRSISSQTETNIADFNESPKTKATTSTTRDKKADTLITKSNTDSKASNNIETTGQITIQPIGANNIAKECIPQQNVPNTTNLASLRLRSLSPVNRFKLKEQESIPCNKDRMSSKDQFYSQMYPKELSGPINYNNCTSRSFSQPHGAYNNQVQTTIELNNQYYNYQQFIQNFNQEFYQTQTAHFGYNGYNDGQQYHQFEELAYYQNPYMNPNYFPNRYSYY